MHEEILAALFPVRAQILQIELLPFSFGHYATLHRINSPMITGAQARIVDIMTAVRVCSLTWSQCKDFVATQDEWAEQFAVWLKTLGPHVDWEAKRQLLHDHISDGIHIPNFATRSSNAEAAGPTIGGIGFWPQIRLTLLQEFGVSHDVFMDMPLRLAVMDAIGCLEKHGRVTFLGEAGEEELSDIYAAVDAFCDRLNQKGGTECHRQN